VAADVADMIAGGHERSRSRLRVVALVLAVLAVVAYAGVRADRDRQVHALVASAARAEQVVADAARSLAGLVAYSDAALSHADLGSAQRDAVLQSFVRDSERFRPRMAAPRAAVAAVRVMPWDGRLRAARAAVLARIDAWTAAVDAAPRDPDLLLTVRRDTRGLRQQTADLLLAVAGPRDDPELDRLVSSLRGR
jgi:hypothetical protein